MKKSQLRNIIRESIKKLMNEQGSSNVYINPQVIFCNFGSQTSFYNNPNPGPGPNGTFPWGAANQITLGVAVTLPNLTLDFLSTPQTNGIYEIQGPNMPSSFVSPTFMLLSPGQVYNNQSYYTAAPGVCIGCTNPSATNYNNLATQNDGSCIAVVYGCMDPTAFNYYAGAQQDDGSCVYTPGCTDHAATNYNIDADIDDGSCDYEPLPPTSHSGHTPPNNCSMIIVSFPNAMVTTTYECVQNAQTNSRFDPSTDIGMCILIPQTGEIGQIEEIDPGVPGVTPEVMEPVPCPGSTGPTGPTPAPQSPCTNLIVSQPFGSLSTQQFNCVQNNGLAFPDNSVGKCVVINQQQYKIEEIDQTTGTTFIQGEIVQCSLAEGAISRMQKLANIKNEKI